jgi:hypothetical protein
MFIENMLFLIQFAFVKIIVPITAENSGSEIDASIKSSFDTGNQTNTGNLRDFLANSTNHFIFAHHHTQTAHSGNIQSLQIFFNSSLTK